MKNILNTAGFLSLLMVFSCMTYAAHHADPLLDAVNNPARNSAYSARDASRHPYETLSFFQINPSMHVLELAAGGGWYTEILAPYLKKTASYLLHIIILRQVTITNDPGAPMMQKLHQTHYLLGLKLLPLKFLPLKNIRCQGLKI